MTNSLNQQTYDLFRKDIMTFSLKPGESVSAAKIADRYHVSRTPAREALVKLETEGLVDIYPQSKSLISKIDTDRANEEWFIRKTLELGVVDGLFANVTEKDIKKMYDYCRKMEEISAAPRTHDSAYEYLKSDDEFHAMTFHIAGESLAADILASTMVHYNRIRLLIDLDDTYSRRTDDTHVQLVKHLERGEKEAYRELLTKHLGYHEQDTEDLREKYPGIFTDKEEEE